MVMTLRRMTFLLALIAVAGSLLFPQPVRLTAQVDPKTYRIGDWIDVHVTGTVDAAVDSVRAAVADSLGPFEVLTVQRSGTQPEWLIRLSTVDSGKSFIPPIPFVYRAKGDTALQTAYTNALTITVAGLTINPQGEIKDIKPPLSAPWKFEDFVPYLIGLVVLALAVAGYLYYRRKRKQALDHLVDVRPAMPPHREALTALRILEEKKLWQQGHVKEYYSEVTEIIRRFFEGRWNIMALERTTDEILDQMRGIPDALSVWESLRAFLTTADLVKFAKSQPTPAEHELELRWGYEIVRAMVPPEPAAVAPEPEKETADVR